MNGATERTGGLRALLETLRAPLLLSPIADVIGGASVALAAHVSLAAAQRDLAAHRIQRPELGDVSSVVAIAAAAGICLLASGMAQNALVDLADDRVRKPDRPLPRGAVSEETVRAVHLRGLVLGVALCGLLSLEAMVVAAAIGAVTWAYHSGLKDRRVLGCVALGAARALDMLLGVVAVDAAFDLHEVVAPGAPSPAGLDWAAHAWYLLGFPVVYGAYIFGASLHASTDDSERTPRLAMFSRFGLTLCGVILLGLAVVALLQTEWQFEFGGPDPQRGHFAGAVLIIALLRLIRAGMERPPPVVTGVALSNLFLLQAGIAAHYGMHVSGFFVILAAFFTTRLMLRAFPPS